MESITSKDLLIIGDTQHNADAYHLCRFSAPDPVICARTSGRTYLAVSSMEYGRALEQAHVDEVLSFDALDLPALAKELKDGDRALAAAAAHLLKELGAESATVPPSFGIIYAEELRRRDIHISPDSGIFSSLRRSKTEEEISYIQKTQRATEAACELGIEMLREAKIGMDNMLVWRGEPLTSERLRTEIEIELLRYGCVTDSTITAGGARSADPHEVGHGPLKSGEAVILDIFPVDKKSHYYADMTRTIFKGEPSAELEQMYQAVLASQEAALEMVRAGVNGRDVHRRVSEVLHDAGYKTLLHDREEGKPLQEGFIHGTGHGVGLEIHESPRISLMDEELKTGDVVTVEPGLYKPGTGGVRLEDLVVVTANGYRNLTQTPKSLMILD